MAASVCLARDFFDEDELLDEEGAEEELVLDELEVSESESDPLLFFLLFLLFFLFFFFSLFSFFLCFFFASFALFLRCSFPAVSQFSTTAQTSSASFDGPSSFP